MTEETLMLAEKPRIRSDAAPPRAARQGALHALVGRMCRGDWTMVPHERAKSIQKVVRQLGGQATRYKTSDLFSVVKVLDAPWNEPLRRAA